MRPCFVNATRLPLIIFFMTPNLSAAGCSAAPTRDPHETQPIPEGAKFQNQCTFLGEIGCILTFWFSGDAGYEGRAACIAFVEPNGTKVEQCGSVTGSTPRP